MAKNTKIEGIATVVEIDSWMPAPGNGPQWENPLVIFSVNGQEYSWRASGEHQTHSLRKGNVLNLRGFLNAQGRIIRPAWTAVGEAR